MTDETVKNVSVTGRYTETTTKTTNVNNDNRSTTVQTTTKFFAKDGTQLKAGYYDAAEAKDLAHLNGYDDHYKTEVVKKDGKYFVKVTVKSEQSIGILAEDYMPKGRVNDGTLKANNPDYFVGIHCEYGDGKTASDLNHKMSPGDSLLIPAEAVEIKSSTVGWFRRNVMNTMY